ncbi:protein of unknown function [Pedococcus dokdonensis]|uniref:HNH nuclease domain-containing protein n=1 Tax=Pedococcus dokdonensis TaxID=443156 RepID=A0A1H0TTM4_9MICO|nr:DUF222 domain-containing protein [Pedococcus dokdonensis]SDP56906.1 protein of unknown function [Pedococcus dokdonensis]
MPASAAVAAATAVAVTRSEAHEDVWMRTAEVAGRLNRLQGELVDLAVEVIEHDLWGDGGFRSPEHYFVVRAGLSPAHARDVVAIARRRCELPDATAALREGTLSLDQAAVVAHHAPVTHQASAAEFARHATVPQLRRALSRQAFAATVAPDQEADPDPDPDVDPVPVQTIEHSASERRACARPELSMHYDTHGRFQLRYSAPAPVGALVEQALKEAKDALFTDAAGESGAGPAVAGSSVARPATGAGRPSYADALEEIAQRSLSSVESSGRAGHYRVYLHLATDGAWVNAGGAIPRRLLDRFVSDGVVQPVWETEGRPVSVGRAMRILPRRSRRLIEDRDRGCRFPGCSATRFVEIHHLHEWASGGATDVDNQVSLCPFHHDAIDRGDYRVSGDPTRPDGLLVTNRHGLRVRPPTAVELAAPPGGDPPEQPGAHAAYQPPTGERARWHDIEILPDDASAWSRQLRAVPAVPWDDDTGTRDDPDDDPDVDPGDDPMPRCGAPGAGPPAGRRPRRAGGR